MGKKRESKCKKAVLKRGKNNHESREERLNGKGKNDIAKRVVNPGVKEKRCLVREGCGRIGRGGGGGGG